MLGFILGNSISPFLFDSPRILASYQPNIHQVFAVLTSKNMGLFKRKTEKEKLQAKYKKLMEESYKLSHSNRSASDEKTAEADAVLKQIDALP